MSNKTRQNNKRADRKMESNGSPEIPDRRETSEEPGLPSGRVGRQPQVSQRGRNSDRDRQRRIQTIRDTLDRGRTTTSKFIH